MTEEWRWIPGWEGRYEISDLGSVRSWITCGRRLVEPRVRKPQPQIRGGYLAVNLSSADRAETRKIHRLVLEIFVGECPPGMEGCHNNGNKADNRLCNLRWDTRSANQQDGVRHGAWSSGNTQKTHCKRGHEFNDANTAIVINHGRPARRCRECRRISPHEVR